MSELIVAPRKVVSLSYTLRNGEGELLDQSDAQDPLHYLHGASNIIPGLEVALEGKKIGEKVSVTVPPEQAYGAHEAERVQKLPREAFGDLPLEVGMELAFQEDEESEDYIDVWVRGLSDTHVEVDFNHPLAGVTLHFEAEVLAIRDATADELEHGHAHGDDGHHH